jgi:hypothetical protein
MKTPMVALCACLVLAVGSERLFADVNVDSATRSVTLTNTPNSNSDSVTTTSGTYTKDLTDSGGSDNSFTQGEASQTTDIEPLVFRGDGHAFVDTSPQSPSGATAESLYQVNFTTDTFYTWTTSGSLTRLVDGGSSVAVAQFHDITHNADLLLKVNGSTSAMDITGTGLIGPGSYFITFSADAFGANTALSAGNSFAVSSSISVAGGFADAHAGYEDVALKLVPQTPEPASLGVLALGALGLLIRRRRQA